jgi:hypothetical protein
MLAIPGEEDVTGALEFAQLAKPVFTRVDVTHAYTVLALDAS